MKKNALYTTAQIARAIGVTFNLFQYRQLTGIFPKAKVQLGKKKYFTEKDFQEIKRIAEALSEAKKLEIKEEIEG